MVSKLVLAMLVMLVLGCGDRKCPEPKPCPPATPCADAGATDPQTPPQERKLLAIERDGSYDLVTVTDLVELRRCSGPSCYAFVPCRCPYDCKMCLPFQDWLGGQKELPPTFEKLMEHYKVKDIVFVGKQDPPKSDAPK